MLGTPLLGVFDAGRSAGDSAQALPSAHEKLKAALSSPLHEIIFSLN